MEEVANQVQVEKSGFRVPPKFGIIGTIAAFVFLILIGSVLLSGSKKTQDSTTPGDNSKSISQPSNAIVYGYWSDDKSILKYYDLSTKEDLVLATLPKDIKHVKVLPGNRISYIKNTDEYDHGKEIVIYDLKTAEEKTAVTSTSGFGIDDYVVSSSGIYFATWEIAVSSNDSLSGGKSRVYSLRLGESKNLLFDDQITPGNPVRYPLAIKNDGTVIADKFLPNSGSGWGYGMEISSFDGKNILPVEKMVNGSYSTQPLLSIDGTTLVFAGFNGDPKDGAALTEGHRKAILNPNTIEILDLDSLERKIIVPFKEGVIYPNVFWDTNPKYVLFSQISSVDTLIGTYKVNTATLAKNPAVNNALLKNTNPNILATLSNGKVLEGDVVNNKSAGGNLGPKYSPTVSALYVLDPTSGEKERVNILGGYAQIIMIGSNNLFSKNTGSSPDATSSEQLQLSTFSLKPTLIEKREEQQSEPEIPKPGNPAPPQGSCREIASKICNELLGTDFHPDQYGDTDNHTYNKCFHEQARKILGGAVSTCGDSPLYLYGPEGTKINIKIGTPIYSSNVSYDPQVGYDVILRGNGEFLANNIIVSSLSFDYENSIKKLPEPNTGYIVSQENLTGKLLEISKKIGLNTKETKDLVEFASKKMMTPFVFVSFYDDITSKKILPIYFEPQPDTYRNIVFYFKGFNVNPNLSINPPKIEIIKRVGITAIEISYILQ